MTTSRLLASLLDQARTAPNKLDWARSVCRAAAHNARSGRFDDSIAKITQVRAEFGPNLHAHVASWLMLAEGVLHWCQFEAQPAYDRIMRAHALAVAFRAEAALPSCAAWMALVEFNLSQYAKMAQHLDDAFTLARPDDHQARGRATLVLADAYHLASGYPLARPWYEQARRHATAEGDEATLGSMLFNVAAFRIANIRVLDAFGTREEAEIDRAGLEAGGSATFDWLTKNSNQKELGVLLQAQLKLSECKFAEALKVFDGLNMDNVDSGRFSPMITIDRAWCHLKLGTIEQALAISKDLEGHQDSLRDTDDRAYLLGRLASIAEMTNQTVEAPALRARAEQALAAHQAFKEELLQALQKIRATATM